MSNFMDFLKNSGSSKTNRIVQESLTRTSGPSEFYGSERKQEKYEKKEKIKNYSHGNSALVTKVGDDYKGYYGHVTDFFPATYELKTEGETYIEADEIIYISKKIITKFGESKILEKIVATQSGADYIDFIVYTDRETLKQKIGLYVDDTNKIVSYLESQGNDSNQAYITRENKNNNFLNSLK